MDQPQRTHCDNCRASLTGEFCSECGQAARDYNVPIGTFAKDMVSESFDLDSRLRATMHPLFFRPGLVPKEYVGGHRARFVPPFRLYLLASFAMFLLMSLGSGINVDVGERPPQFEIDLDGRSRAAVETEAGATEARANAQTASDSVGASPTDSLAQRIENLERSLETRLSEGVSRAAEDPGTFAEEFSNRMAQAMFLLLPVFAVLLKLLYRNRLYVHHIVFAIYFHAWFFLVVAVTLVPGAFGFNRVSDVMAIVLLWAPVYLFLAMRRFYAQSRLLTFVKLLALSNIYLVIASLTMLAVIIWTIAGD